PWIPRLILSMLHEASMEQDKKQTYEGDIMRFRIYSLLGLLVCGATLFPWPSAQARNTLALLNAEQISPKSQIVDFRQTQFVFASSIDTDCEHESVDVVNMKLR